MKHLLVLLSPEGDQVGPYALALAKQFDAHPTVIAYAFEPSLPYFATDSLGDVVAQARDAAAHAATQDLAKFESRAKQIGLNVVVTSLVASTERLAHETARLARCHDLTIMQQNQGRELERSLLTAALFGSGRPILVVPDTYNAPAKLSTVLIAWDGGAPAARAAADALPILQRAGAVRIVSVLGPREGDLEADQVSMVRHLALHGISAEASILAGTDVAGVLLSYVADVGADLLVMGGYGHSRFREFVLGGTTRDILASTTVPIFMAH